jgi:hypothetical protein
MSWNPVATSGIVIGVFPMTRPSKITCAPDGRDSTCSEAGPVTAGPGWSAAAARVRGGTRPTAVGAFAGLRSVGCCGVGSAAGLTPCSLLRGAGSAAGLRLCSLLRGAGSAARSIRRGGPAAPAGTIGSEFRFTGSWTADSLNGCPPVAPDVAAGFSVAVAATDVEPFPARYPLAKPIPMPITSAAAAANQMLTPPRGCGSSIDEANSDGSLRTGSVGSALRKPLSGKVGGTAVSRNGKSTSGSSEDESDPCSGGPFREALRS